MTKLSVKKRRIMIVCLVVLVSGAVIAIQNAPSAEPIKTRRPEGIFVNPFQRGEIGPDLFLAACRMGLEALVSKHRCARQAFSGI